MLMKMINKLKIKMKILIMKNQQISPSFFSILFQIKFKFQIQCNNKKSR